MISPNLAEKTQTVAIALTPGGDRRRSVVEMKDGPTLGEGAEGAVHLANIAIYGTSNGRELPLAHKVLYEPESAPLLVDRYRRLRNAGLPVPRTFRMASESNGQLSILMTDLTEGNTNLLIEPGDAQLRQLLRERPALRTRVKGIDLRSHNEHGALTDLEGRLYSYAETAARNGILLSSDAPRLVLHPDDSYDVVFSDMGFIVGGERTPSGGYDFSVKGPGSWRESYEEVTMTVPELEIRNIQELDVFRKEMQTYQI